MRQVAGLGGRAWTADRPELGHGLVGLPVQRQHAPQAQSRLHELGLDRERPAEGLVRRAPVGRRTSDQRRPGPRALVAERVEARGGQLALVGAARPRDQREEEETGLVGAAAGEVGLGVSGMALEQGVEETHRLRDTRLGELVVAHRVEPEPHEVGVLAHPRQALQGFPRQRALRLERVPRTRGFGAQGRLGVEEDRGAPACRRRPGVGRDGPGDAAQVARGPDQNGVERRGPRGGWALEQSKVAGGRLGAPVGRRGRSRGCGRRRLVRARRKVGLAGADFRAGGADLDRDPAQLAVALRIRRRVAEQVVVARVGLQSREAALVRDADREAARVVGQAQRAGGLAVDRLHLQPLLLGAAEPAGVGVGTDAHREVPRVVEVGGHASPHEAEHELTVLAQQGVGHEAPGDQDEGGAAALRRHHLESVAGQLQHAARVRDRISVHGPRQHLYLGSVR